MAIKDWPGGVISKTPVVPDGGYLNSAASGVWTLDQVAYWTKQQQWPGTAVGDPYFYDVSLLLTGDGTNGAQNNTFLDSSTNNFTITRNGNTTQGTFSPYGSLWSNYFDGSGDYLTGPNNSAFDLGSGDFTIEFWVNVSGLFNANIDGNRVGSIVRYSSGTVNKGYEINIDQTSSRISIAHNGTGNGMYCSASFAYGTWYHVAFVRNSGSNAIYINGVSQTLTTNTYTGVSDPTGTLAIATGRVFSGYNHDFFGYISNLRIVKGTALYTSNFTPSTTPLTAVSGTSLLTCQSNRFKDNSSNNFTLTVSGNTSVQRFSPFNPTAPYSAATIGGSGYFDGSGDYVQAPSNSLWSWPLVSAWSGEAFIYPTSFSTYNPVFCVGGAGTNILDFYVNSSGNLVLRYWNGSAQVLTSSSTVKLNEWSHVVFAFNGTTLSTYINGARVATAAKQGTPDSNTNPFNIGYMTQGTGTGVFTGYISDVRVINGTLQYNPSNSTITVPTAPLTAITNTSLLCNFTNAGIPDAAMMNDLETVGNAQVSTSVKKYGTGSLAFDGTGDYLNVPSTQNVNFGTGNFTIEFWAYWAGGAFSTYNVAFDSRSGNSPFTDGVGIAANITNGYWYITFAGQELITSTAATAGWQHIALVRNNGVFTLYINGTSGGTYTATNNMTNTTAVIGTYYAKSQYYWNGYIDDLRITKGYARYTSSFTPPTAAFPTF